MNAEDYLREKYGEFNKFHPADQLTGDFDIEDIINVMEEYHLQKQKADAAPDAEIEQLGFDYAKEIHGESNQYTEPNFTNCQSDYMAGYKAALQSKPVGDAAPDGWIRVEDGLPETGQIVDTWNGIANRRAKFEKPDLFIRHVEPFSNERIYITHFPDITHWQPLPPPPKTIRQ